MASTTSRLKTLLIINFTILVLAFFGVKKFVSISEAQGTVKGICYTIEDSTALVDEEIVREGSEVHGIKVYKIERNCVVFQKAQTYWSQRVLEKPTEYWKID